VESLKSLLLFGGKTRETSVVFSGPASDAFSIFVLPIVTPIQWAARLHRVECLKVCLDHVVKSEGRGTVAYQGCFDGGVFLNDINDTRSGNMDTTALAVKNCAKGGRYSLLSEAIQALPDTYLHRLGIHGARHIQEMKDTIEVLIQNGVGLENLSGWGENCVGTAVLRGNASTLRYLLEVTGETFIHLPLHMNVAKLTTTPLGIACRRGDEEIFDVLLEFGANVGASAPVIGPKDCRISRKRLAPLHVCAISRHQNIIAFARALLDRGAEVDPGDEFLPTPLYFALLEGEFELAQLLIDCGADMRARQYSEDGRTYKTLVGAVISQIFSQVPFSTGCDPFKILDFLLQSQSRGDPALFLEPMNSSNSTIFHIAAAAFNIDLADPDEISGRNLWSSLIGHINCPQDFLNAQNIHGETPLHVACANLDLTACEALLQAGCYATGVNIEGKTPHEVAKVALCESNVAAELMRWNRDRIIRLLPPDEKAGTLP
jgi:ankyrin repeat protein